MLIVGVMLFMNYSVYDGMIPWQWPVVRWQMYGHKSRLEPSVTFRSLVAMHADGHEAPTSDCGTLPFLARAYRLDAALRRDRVGLLTTCLRELRGDVPSVTAVAHEVRRWDYQKQSLAEALEQAPEQEFRVASLPGDLPENSASGAGVNLVENGGFTRLDRKTGSPLAWSTNKSRWTALGVDLQSGNRAGLILREPGGKAQRWEQKLRLAPTAEPTRLRVEALVHAGEGAALSLHVPGLDPARVHVTPEGSRWRRLELELDAPARPKHVTAILRLSNSGASDFFVDDVSLTEAPRPPAPLAATP